MLTMYNFNTILHMNFCKNNAHTFGTPRTTMYL